ncbi:MAG: N-acetylmuramoyl-L-alanine amidase [Bacillota bacterium]
MRQLLAALCVLLLHSLFPVAGAWARPPCVVLDPGHGGVDPGAVADGGVYEKTINLALARRIKTFLENDGITVILTRTGDDSYRTLTARAALANARRAHLFISLHANSDHPSCHGIELYHYPGSLRGEAAARLLKEAIEAYGGLAPCRIKAARYLVLEKTAMPALLVEAGYLSNPYERRRLLDVSYRQELARAVAAGVTRYLECYHLPCRSPVYRVPRDEY